MCAVALGGARIAAVIYALALGLSGVSCAASRAAPIELILVDYEKGFDLYLINDGVGDVRVHPEIRAYGGGGEVTWQFYRGDLHCRECVLKPSEVSPYRGPPGRPPLMLAPQELFGVRLPFSRLIYDYNVGDGCYRVRAVYEYRGEDRSVFKGRLLSNFREVCHEKGVRVPRRPS